MMLRAQFERGTGAFIPGQGEYMPLLPAQSPPA